MGESLVKLGTTHCDTSLNTSKPQDLVAITYRRKNVHAKSVEVYSNAVLQSCGKEIKIDGDRNRVGDKGNTGR